MSASLKFLCLAAVAALCLVPSDADAGILFGRRTKVVNNVNFVAPGVGVNAAFGVRGRRGRRAVVVNNVGVQHNVGFNRGFVGVNRVNVGYGVRTFAAPVFADPCAVPVGAAFSFGY